MEILLKAGTNINGWSARKIHLIHQPIPDQHCIEASGDKLIIAQTPPLIH
jgi:hypothetical protein